MCVTGSCVTFGCRGRAKGETCWGCGAELLRPHPTADAVPAVAIRHAARFLAEYRKRRPGASKGTPGDAKYVSEIIGGGTKIRKLGRWGQNLPFCFKGK